MTDIVSVGTEWTTIKAGPFSGRVSALSGGHVIVAVSAETPESNQGHSLEQSMMAYVQLGQTLYARSYRGTNTVQVSEQMINVSSPPINLLTNSGGIHSRMRVDVASTGFFLGREFRIFKEFESATTSTYIIKAVAPINIILHELLITTEAGSIRFETVVGGTEGGTFGEVITPLPTNTMTEKPQPPYAPQVTVTAGGTLTGGTDIDVFRDKVADNANFSASISVGSGSERGVAAGTYYFRMTLTGFIGIIKARWEERP